MLRYHPRLKGRSRFLRAHLTDAEQRLWARLRRKQILAVQFYRQKPIGNYIVDFYAPVVRLVVEIDGSQHLEATQAENDRRRTEYLEQMGLRVLRYTDLQVLLHLESVVEDIFRVMEGKIPLYPLCQRGNFLASLNPQHPSFPSSIRKPLFEKEGEGEICERIISILTRPRPFSRSSSRRCRRGFCRPWISACRARVELHCSWFGPRQSRHG